MPHSHTVNFSYTSVPMPTRSLPYVLLLSLFWGTNVVASRFGIGEFNPYLFITLRLATATLFFVPILLLNQEQLPCDPQTWRLAAISGVLGVAIPMSTFILSLQYQSSGVASIYITMSPVLIVLAAHFVLPDEKITRYKALGVALALSGALFLALRGESGLAGVGRASPLGFVLVMMGIVSETVNTMFVRLRMRALDPMQVTAIRLFVAALIVLTITLFVGDFSFSAVTAAGYFSLAYAGIIGALGGQFMAFYIQRRFGATAFSMTDFIVPLIATVFGALLLDEVITWPMGIGVLLIGGGLFLLNRQIT